MTIALVDVPFCLNVDTWYVGPARDVKAPVAGRQSDWKKALDSGGTPGYRKQAVSECLDTVAVMRGYREPLPGETWLIPAASERRLLAQVNAIIALGRPALDQVTDMALDSDVPDPGRVFAALLVIGCVEGGHWLALARELFVAASLRNPAEAAAAAEAMSLAPNPDLNAVLTALLDDERPRVRTGAIRALAFRGSLHESRWTDAMRDRDVTVLTAALTAPLGGYDRSGCGHALQPLFAVSAAEPAVRYALRAGLSLGLNAARDCAVQIARRDPSWADAIRVLAMFGHVGDAQYVREALLSSELQGGIDAAATLGTVRLVPDLLEVLHRDDLSLEMGMAANQALSAITGLPFASMKNAAQAARLWMEHSSEFDLHIRYREGRPLNLEVLLQSLRTGPATRTARQNIFLEMQAATESRVPRFNSYDFIGVQTESLRRIERWLADPRVQRNTSTIRH